MEPNQPTTQFTVILNVYDIHDLFKINLYTTYLFRN